MIGRRLVLGASAVVLGGAARRAHRPGRPRGARRARSYAAFLAGIRDEALRAGIRREIVRDALALDRPNLRVLELDRRQPEFTLTWSRYRDRVLTARMIDRARSAYGQRTTLLTAIGQGYQVDPRVAVAIWGVESDFGRHTGSFGVVDALASLAFDGRRAGFFSCELIKALTILDRGDVGTAAMLGSYAGAMGQPQFMPSSYLRFAVDYDGDGRRDIWSSDADVLASICTYLSRNGWLAGQPWGQPIRLPPGSDRIASARSVRRSLADWMQQGVRRADGTRFGRGDVIGEVLLPDGPGGEALMVYRNFDVLRSYNPSDFYGLAVGLLARSIA